MRLGLPVEQVVVGFQRPQAANGLGPELSGLAGQDDIHRNSSSSLQNVPDYSPPRALLGSRGRQGLDLDVVAEPELADQAVAFVQPGTQPLLFLPVRLGQLLGPLENPAGAFPALPHPAAISQMRQGKLRDARSHDEIGVVSDLTLVGLPVAMKGDPGHPIRPAATAARLAAPWARRSRSR